MGSRPLYTVTFRAESGVDGLRAVRALLKIALRTFGLRCVRIAEEADIKADIKLSLYGEIAAEP
jgi:hypothetical protein